MSQACLQVRGSHFRRRHDRLALAGLGSEITRSPSRCNTRRGAFAGSWASDKRVCCYLPALYGTGGGATHAVYGARQLEKDDGRCESLPSITLSLFLGGGLVSVYDCHSTDEARQDVCTERGTLCQPRSENRNMRGAPRLQNALTPPFFGLPLLRRAVATSTKHTYDSVYSPDWHDLVAS